MPSALVAAAQSLGRAHWQSGSAAGKVESQMIEIHKDPTLREAIALERDAKRCAICKNAFRLSNNDLRCGVGESVMRVMAAERLFCAKFREGEA